MRGITFKIIIKHFMLRELCVILYCSYVEGKLGLKSPMTGDEAGT